ncbi:prion-like-(Q/N-rich) domain-bearing protein 25 isoform X2 [Biomphalaria glabrata]|uniref:Prion-like-(Q/N-rich) domain-bearing protein 25 isoform X2 n=1 Tax=Biomphalaria glabrata TaxID=6526 RepID=A0A9W3AQQ1_BIOGL|nr:prion-like-(Q/N-rich) domain-bearing protein 25 isoform X2 [Biomphalaria glabrata]
MGTLCHVHVFLILSICTLKYLDAYTRCNTPDYTKKAYGQSCTTNSQCVTEYCNPDTKTCNCHSDSFIDSTSGLCVKNGGPIFSSAGECGYLVSPSSVSPGSLVNWSIYGEPRTYITIVVVEVDMYQSTGCGTNYLEILEGSTHLLYKTCDRMNSTKRFLASKSNNLTVLYQKASSSYRGFRAIYYTRSTASELNERSGYIVSPGYPVSYNEILNNTWLISAEPGNIIRTTFLLVDTETCCDHVRVYDGRYFHSTSLTNISGSVSLRTSTSTANYLLIQFITDGSVSHTGFTATYEVNDIGYGNSCTTSTCIGGLVCLDGHCGCSYNQYYDNISRFCLPSVNFGYSCRRSEECFQGLVCRDSVCACTTSQYYNYDTRYCRSGMAHGYSCTNSSCVDGLYCLSGVCSCSSNQFYDQNIGICKDRITYGNICNSTEQCVADLACNDATCDCLTSYYYDQTYSICRLRLSYGNVCISTSQCLQDFVCTENSCNCSSNSYYNNLTCVATQWVATTIALTHKHSHTFICSTSEDCTSPYVCRSERIITKKCLCPSDMYFITSNCLNQSTVQAVVSSSSIVKTDSILLKWTTQIRISNFSFTVEWEGHNVATNASELYIDGLSPGHVYSFTITTNIPADDYYNNKSIQSNVSMVTKQVPGSECSNYYECSDETSCVSGYCICLYQYYLNKISKTCEPRLTKSYECSQTDECKDTLACIHGRCDCQPGNYYDSSKQSCYIALKRGQLCDPSIENMCELPDLICGRENTYTSNYTCQRNPTRNETGEIVSQKNTSGDNPNTVFIAVAVVGWVAALAAVIAVIVICSRNRKKSQTKGPETQTIEAMSDLKGTSDSNVPRKNDYRLFPKTTDVQSTSSTTLSTSEISKVQPAVPALAKSNIKPKASSKPSSPFKTSSSTNKLGFSAKPKFVQDNKSFTPDSPDNSYEEITPRFAYADDDKVYQNVQNSKENVYINSNI